MKRPCLNCKVLGTNTVFEKLRALFCNVDWFKLSLKLGAPKLYLKLGLTPRPTFVERRGSIMCHTKLSILLFNFYDFHHYPFFLIIIVTLGGMSHSGTPRGFATCQV
jgi:hypothetical protein